MFKKLLKLIFLRSILGASSRPKPEFFTYEGSLTDEHLIDWINELDKYIDYDEVEEEKKFRLAIIRLKGHASLCWDSVQDERRRKCWIFCLFFPFFHGF